MCGTLLLCVSHLIAQYIIRRYSYWHRSVRTKHRTKKNQNRKHTIISMVLKLCIYMFISVFCPMLSKKEKKIANQQFRQIFSIKRRGKKIAHPKNSVMLSEVKIKNCIRLAGSPANESDIYPHNWLLRMMLLLLFVQHKNWNGRTTRVRLQLFDKYVQ